MKTKLLLAATILAFCSAPLAQQRSVRCTSYPTCDTPGKVCKGVQQTYTGSAAGKAKESIVQACVKATRPDPCNCVQACRKAAQCGS